jgi:AcrR family transcriptional regulator
MDVSEIVLTARDRSRLETRGRLLGSARRLFSTRGLTRVTTHDIARGAGVASGTFYLHFPDKETLFREIVDSAVEELCRRVESATEGIADAEVAARSHAETLIGFAEENRDLVRIVFGRDHSTADVESDVMDHLAATAARMLQRRIDQGVLRSSIDPTVAAQALTGMFARAVSWWIEDPRRCTRAALIDTLVGIQLGGTYAS